MAETGVQSIYGSKESRTRFRVECKDKVHGKKIVMIPSDQVTISLALDPEWLVGTQDDGQLSVTNKREGYLFSDFMGGFIVTGGGSKVRKTGMGEDWELVC